MGDPPIVLILGRPNVGKSALFNRIGQRRKSIVHPVEGVTRDIVAVETDWNGRAFRLVDSGGLDFTSGDEIKDQVQEIALSAIKGAALTASGSGCQVRTSTARSRNRSTDSLQREARTAGGK